MDPWVPEMDSDRISIWFHKRFNGFRFAMAAREAEAMHLTWPKHGRRASEGVKMGPMVGKPMIP